MTRTDVMASSRPRTAGAAKTGGKSFGSLRRMIAVPVVLLLALAMLAPTAALAASSTASKEGLSEYEKPKKVVIKKTPEHEEREEQGGEEPKEESKLPFTGFDLRWSVGFGLLLMGAGASIVVVQRRNRGR
jgi:hypothetical protein